jgi:hypothetical protein
MIGHRDRHDRRGLGDVDRRTAVHLGPRITGALALALLAALVWLTGQLAGLLFGHAWLRLDPGELAATVIRLPFVLDDPKRAWPAEARAELPGPVGMYATAAVVALASAVLAAGAIRWLLGGRRGRSHARAARWATGWELGP